ncbi:MAG: methyltransferase domain-containing protein [Bacillota bacterium]
MTKIRTIDDPNYVHHQYQNASNLNVRIALHEKFSTNPYRWQHWLFDQIHLTAPCRVLELGCGAGNFWMENIDRVPHGLDVTLSDASEGMLDQTRRNLGEKAGLFRFEVIDAQSIPYAAGTFDAVLACHMLYHVPDRAKAISEIRRVLKPDGVLYATTASHQNLKEIATLLKGYEEMLSAWRSSAVEGFSVETGLDQLKRNFADVEVIRYHDALEVTDAQMLADYLLSGRIELPGERREEFIQYVHQELERQGGCFHITKEAGLLIARGIAAG